MVYYTLHKEDIIYDEPCPKSRFIEVLDFDNEDIQKSIDNFNSLYSWAEMFDIEEVKRRLKRGDKFFLFYFNDKVSGHCWLSKNVERMGFLSEKVLPSQSLYCYNVFVDKTIHDKDECSSTVYLSEIFKILFFDGYKKIHLYTDDWNKSAQVHFEKIGFIEDDWTITLF